VTEKNKIKREKKIERIEKEKWIMDDGLWI